MTRLFVILVALATSLVALPAFACGDKDSKETTASAEGDVDVTLAYAVVSVKNVDCAGCYVPIRQELTAMSGIKTIEEGEDLGKLVIGYDTNSKITDAQLKAAVKKAGYDCNVQMTAEKPAAKAPAKQS